MSDQKQPAETPCREFELLMMRRIDGEISPVDEKRLQKHLESCPLCRKALDEYSRLAAATGEVEMRKVSQEEWDIYWYRVYNRLERGLAWILVSLGAVAAFAWMALRLVMHFVSDPTTALWAKGGILVLAAGLALLFISVLREKLSLRRTDRYRHIKR